MSNLKCLRCLRRFKRESDFDKHLTGPFGRCMTDEGLIHRDMVKNRRGEWVTPKTAGKKAKP